jgi:hypothetical protein
MITFRDVMRRETTEEKLDYLASRIALGDAEGALMEAGELEQGVLDALHDGRDHWGEVEQLLREVSRASGAAYRASRAGRSPHPQLRRVEPVLERLRRQALPRSLEVRAPEGYLHYALDPMGYASAAARYAREVGAGRAARAVVVGVRSVGTSLSAVVAAELGALRSATVRPRGATSARHVSASPSLTCTLLRWLGAEGDALIVDEGPGATGETFHCVARWLQALGVEPSRIVLFPSHLQPPSLGDGEVLHFFSASRRYGPPNDDDRIERVCARFGLEAPEDLSAGRWRAVVPGAADAVAVPRHERLKFRAWERTGEQRLIRFAGLGRAGTEALIRAQRLATLGFGPTVIGREGGFTVLSWIEGHCPSPACISSPAFLETLAAYLAARVSLFRTGEAVEVAPMVEVLRANATEVLGASPAGLAAAMRRLERLPAREAIVPDARLQAREWVRTPRGFLKLDATDHGDGLRLPGPTDSAWDVAAALVEFQLGSPADDELVRRCGRGAPGGPTHFARAVAAYRAPYAAAALGEAVLAVREGGGTPEDQQRLERDAARYRHLLRRELALAPR